MVTFLIVFIGLSFLILAHEAGHFFVAKYFKLKVHEFGFGFPPRLFAKKWGETEYSVNLLPFGGFVKIAGENDHLDDPGKIRDMSLEEKRRLLSFQKAWKKASVVAAGVIINFLIGWIFVTAIFMIGIPPALVITDVQPNSPAESAGFMSGDIVKGFETNEAFVSFVGENKGEETSFAIFREGKEVTLIATPRVSSPPGEGSLGVQLVETGTLPQPFFAAFGNGFLQSYNIAKLTLFTFFDLIKSLFTQGTLLPGVVGPVGIFSVAYQAGAIGFVFLAQLIGIISINLAVINLLPVPALDGGRLLLIFIERIKGSPVSQKIEIGINTAGFLFLIILMVMLTIRDVGNLF